MSAADTLVRIAQGDAYCAATEYIKLPRDENTLVRSLAFTGYQKHPKHNIRAGLYTDDTQMSLAVAETLLATKNPTKLDFACAFVEAYQRDKRDGYARGFQAFLDSISTGQEFLEKIKPDSTKNGAAMRSVPLGFLESTDEVLSIAQTQASITHNTADGIFSSQAVGLFAFFALRGIVPADWTDACRSAGLDVTKYLTGNWSGPVKSGATSVAVASVDAAYTALLGCSTVSSLLRQIILWGGDTDSVAAIAMGLGIGLEQDMPDWFETALEAGSKYGVAYMRMIGQKLTGICLKGSLS